MNKLEKAILMLFFSFLFIFPLAAEAYGIWFIAVNYAQLGLYALFGMIGITVATVLSGAQFYYILTNHFCSKCVNFSCPGNTVPKPIVDKYLAKNPLMREAWERSGYKLR